ncbi:MAG: hypothetical protein JO250_13390 [Armatimonadetes bacterium]|nr:hypothetical protein [Armatimonadota bacterium]
MPEEQIATQTADAVPIATGGESVTGAHLHADGGKEKETVTLSPHAGASSDAPASSGIPSAMTQHRARGEETDDTEETAMGDRSIPVRQNLKP